MERRYTISKTGGGCQSAKGIKNSHIHNSSPKKKLKIGVLATSIKGGTQKQKEKKMRVALLSLGLFTVSLTDSTESGIASNDGIGKSSGFMSDASVKIFERENV